MKFVRLLHNRTESPPIEYHPYGWQIYTEPKPTFKVGDWVKYDIDTYLRVIEPSGKERTLCRTLSGEGVIVYPYTSLLTKVSPSEVVVHIGGLSGTVSFADADRFILRGIGNSKMANACIMFKMLDTATCVLVESLLEAQGEEMNTRHKKPGPPKEPDYIICKCCSGGQSVQNPSVSSTAYTICPACNGTGKVEKLKHESKNIGYGYIYPDMCLKYIDLGRYRVGDWVEIESSHTKGKTFFSVIKEMPNREHYTVHVDSFCGGYYGIMESQIVRKLKPSEVIVEIGCLRGTVRKSCNYAYFLMWHESPKMDLDFSMIKFVALDPKTHELVKSLLKAQEEE